MKKHVALVGKTFCYSDGGIYYLSLLTKALTQKSHSKDHALTISLLLPEHLKLTPWHITRSIMGKIKRILLKIIGSKTDEQNFVPGRKLIRDLKKINKKIHVVFYLDTGDDALAETLQQIKADVVLPVMWSLGPNFPTPWIGALYDFQYKYYPEFFPGSNLEQRDQQTRAMFKNASVIITNSKNTKNDVYKFFPVPHSTILPLPVAAHPEYKNFRYPCVAKYNLPSKFFLISNQFWIHKSHITAFEALKIIHEQATYKDIHIICTGITHDSRFPEYFAALQNKIKALSLENHIIFLGRIPKNHHIAIMQKAIAVIQPTLFEGGPGGGSAQHAIAINTPVILSDIPVNLELQHEAPNIFYFKAKCSESLAEKMVELLRKPHIKKRTNQDLWEAGQQRIKRLSTTLLKAIDIATKSQKVCRK